MTQREVLIEKVKAVLTQETRQKYAMELLAQAEMFTTRKISGVEYWEKTRGIIAAMNAEIREKTGGLS